MQRVVGESLRGAAVGGGEDERAVLRDDALHGGAVALLRPGDQRALFVERQRIALHRPLPAGGFGRSFPWFRFLHACLLFVHFLCIWQV